jgi:hypothetical protein
MHIGVLNVPCIMYWEFQATNGTRYAFYRNQYPNPTLRPNHARPLCYIHVGVARPVLVVRAREKPEREVLNMRLRR